MNKELISVQNILLIEMWLVGKKELFSEFFILYSIWEVKSLDQRTHLCSEYYFTIPLQHLPDFLEVWLY
jgi:hypothetical protein